MNSRTSWSVDGIDPKVRERAEAAARRAGLSLTDWLDASIPDQPPLAQTNPLPPQEAREVAEIHSRLDSITRQIEQMSDPAPRGDTGVARQLNEAISRLDARLSQISEPAAKPAAFAAKPMMASPSISPGSLEDAIAELAARQSELNGGARNAAPAQSKSSGPDFSILERHLLQITGQIDALKRPDIEQSIATFRGELADIRNVITEAMPRRAIESIENEIRSLSKRIDDSRDNGIDGKALAGIERALAEIKEVLRSLTPAEQLAGFDDAIRNLGGKIDLIVRASDDPGTIQQLEGAIAALRAIVSNVASNESLGRLSDDVRLLAAKVDQVSRPDTFSEGFAVLEQRIAALTTTLERRPQGAVSGHSEHLEGALQALSNRLDHLPVGNDSTAAFSHLEQRVSYLLERLEMNNDHRASNLGKVEENLHDILRHLERQSATIATLASPSLAPAASGMDPVLVDQIKRELSEMRFSQTATDRHTQDSLEVVHNTLGHVVDRLAMIEGDLREARMNPAPAPTPAPAAAAAAVTRPTAPRPELPNPVARMVPPPVADQNEISTAAAIAAPRAITDILDQQPMPAMREATPPMEMHQPQMRPQFNPDLPPDHPLEPGTLPQGRVAIPSERTADITGDEPASTSSFIAAARRAAQAAAASVPAKDKAKRTTVAANDKGAEPSTITTKIRSLLVGASVVVIVLGSFKMAMNLLEGTSQPRAETSSEAQPPMTLAPPESSSRPNLQGPAQPSMTSPMPIGRQSLIAPKTDDQPFAGTPTQLANADVTGSIPQPLGAASSLPPAGRKPAQIAIPSTEKLPDGIAGPMLRTAALKGDATAAYEIGLRYAEARGVPANFDEAAKWYDRAAQAGIVPAMFRIGTLYEKGISVKKDPEAARKFYMAAAERGNAKAMHNLAVLDADGGGNGANYKSAAQWFRKAAARGVADSQYNLGILYARGIGVEQNLAESFKWFSLAAAQGDADSGTKRDDIAKRLDPQSLAASKLAIQTFTPEPQPDEAITVATPAGGWDNAGSPAAKPATAKRAAR